MLQTPARRAFVLESTWSQDFVDTSQQTGYLNILANDYVIREEWVSPKVRDKSRAWKPFQHYKRWTAETIWTVKNPVPLSLVIGQSPYLNARIAYGARYNWPAPFGAYGVWDNALPVMYELLEDGKYSIPPPASLSDLVGTSLRVMVPRIRGDLSLINSVLELKDFKRLGQTAKLLRGTMLSLAKGVTRGSLRQVLGSVADGWLQVKFNFQPLFRDILGFRQAVRDITSRIEKMMSYEGNPRVWHFSHQWAEFTDENTTIDQSDHQHKRAQLVGEPLGCDTAGDCKVTRRVRYSPSVFHAQLKFNASYSIAQKELAPLLVLLDGLGVSLNPAIIWNAIPWSFVVDWVARVGDFLDNFSIRNMDPQIHIVDYLWSVKRSRTIDVSVKNTATHWFMDAQPTDGIKYPTIYEASYSRQVGLPDASSTFQWSGLSSTELSLAAALAIVRRTRRRKKPKSKSKIQRKLKEVMLP